MKWVFTEQHCCEYSLLWLLRKTSQEARGWAGQTLDLGWVAQLLASRRPAFTEASKGLAAKESDDCTFFHHLLRSSCTFQRRKIENWWTSIRSQPSSWDKPLLLLEDGRAKTYITCMCQKAAIFVIILGWVPHSLGYPWEEPNSSQRWSLPQQATLSSPERTHHDSGKWRIT